MSEGVRPTRDPFLDLARGLAVIWVVLVHALYLKHFMPYTTAKSYILLEMPFLFFVSGAALYLSHRRDPSIRHFVSRRLVRLLVPYAALAAVCVPLYVAFRIVHHDGVSPAALVAWIELYPKDTVPSYVGEYSWFIRTVIGVSILHLALVRAFGRRFWDVFAPVGLVALVVVASLAKGADHLGFVQTIAGFALFVYAGYAYAAGRVPSNPKLYGALAAVLFFTLAVFVRAGWYSPDIQADKFPPNVAYLMFGFGWLSVLLLVQRWVARMLGGARAFARILNFYSGHSYTVYLWHGFAFWAIDGLIALFRLSETVVRVPWIVPTTLYFVGGAALAAPVAWLADTATDAVLAGLRAWRDTGGRQGVFNAWRLGILGGLIVIAFASRMTFITVASASSGWSQPFLLSNDPTMKSWAWFPAITTDPYGNVHVVWAGQDPSIRVPPGAKTVPAKRLTDDAIWLWYRGWNGQGWSTPTDIAAAIPAGVTLRSALVADLRGRLHLFYQGLNLADPSGGSTSIIRYSSVDAGNASRATAWSPGVTIGWHEPSYLPNAVVDSHNVLHLMWSEYDGKSSYTVYYQRSTDGGKTWSERVTLDSVHAVYWFRFQFRVGPRDDLHAVWEVLNPSDATAWAAPPVGFVYAQSLDGGSTWSTTDFIKGSLAPRPSGPSASPTPTTRVHIPVQPSLGVDGNDRVILVWRDSVTNVIYSQQSADGKMWSQPIPLPGVARGVDRPFDRYDMATDSAGHVHLVFVGFPTGSSVMSLLHSEWNGRTWSEPSTIVGSPLYPEYPGIAISEGNRLHVVWFVGDSDQISRTPVGIYYSTAESAAPFVEPAARPAAAPAAVHAVPTATLAGGDPSRLPVRKNPFAADEARLGASPSSTQPPRGINGPGFGPVEAGLLAAFLLVVFSALFRQIGAIRRPR